MLIYLNLLFNGYTFTNNCKDSQSVCSSNHFQIIFADAQFVRTHREVDELLEQHVFYNTRIPISHLHVTVAIQNRSNAEKLTRLLHFVVRYGHHINVYGMLYMNLNFANNLFFFVHTSLKLAGVPTNYARLLRDVTCTNTE